MTIDERQTSDSCLYAVAATIGGLGILAAGAALAAIEARRKQQDSSKLREIEESLL